MLRILDKNKNYINALSRYWDLRITKKLSLGDRSLEFNVLVEDAAGIVNEGYIETKDDRYVVKEVSPGSDGLVTVYCQLDVESLEGKAHTRFESVEQTLSDAMSLAFTGTGWTVGTCEITKRRTLRKENCSSLEIVSQALSVYRCECIIHSKTKVIDFVEEVGEEKGAYFARDLNLKALEVSRTSYEFYTEIEPYGKDGMTIEAVNSGSKYLTNYTYSTKSKRLIWKDERYTIAEHLKEDAQAKLDDLAKPHTSYQADVIDLANAAGMTIFDYDIGDTIVLIDSVTGTNEKQRIVEMEVYPDEPERNTCVFSNTVLGFEELASKYNETADTVNNITTDNGTVDGSKVDGVTCSQITDFNAGLLSAQAITAITAKIGTLEANVGNFESIKTQDIQSITGYFQHLNAELFDANAGRITVLESNSASIIHLLAHNQQATSVSTINLTADNATFDTAFLKSLMAQNITADDLKAGTIYTNKHTVQSQDGSMVMSGTTLQFKDEDSNTRIQIGKDGQGHFSYSIFDEDGNPVWYQDGITPQGIPDGILVDDMVADTTQDYHGISASKLNINSVIGAVNQEGGLKASSVIFDDDNQSLLVHFARLQSGSVGGRNMMVGTYAPDLENLPHVNEQSQETMTSDGTLSVAEHGFRITNDSAVAPWIMFGDDAAPLVFGTGIFGTNRLAEYNRMLGFDAGEDYVLSFDAAWKLLSNYSGSDEQELTVTLYDSTGTNPSKRIAKLTAGTNDFRIVTQPVDVVASVGDTVQFSVVATGTGLSYQWQYSTNQTTWTNSGTSIGGLTDTISFSIANASQYNIYRRCIITDSNGDQLISDAVRPLAEAPAITITSQPPDLISEAGTSAVFSVTATGSSLTYQWQVKEPDAEDFVNSDASGNQTATLTIDATLVKDGNLYRCVITDGNDNTVTTRNALLEVIEGAEQQKHCVFSFTVPQEATWCYLKVECSDSTDADYDAGDYIELANIMLEKSTWPSNWVPSPEEVDDAIRAVDTKVEITNGRLSALITETEGISTRVASVVLTVDGLTQEYSNLSAVADDYAQYKQTSTESLTLLSNRMSVAEQLITPTSIMQRVSGSSGTTTFALFQDAIRLKTGTLTWTANNSTMNANGDLTASNVDLTGKITATSGKIGNINISTNSIYSGSHSTYDSGNVGFYLDKDGVVGIGNSSKYLRFQNGNFTLNAGNCSIDSSGNWTCTGGAIGNIHIATNSIYSGSHSSYSSGNPGFFLGSDGTVGIGNSSKYLRWYNGNFTLNAGNCTIDSSGNLTATNFVGKSANIDGVITSNKNDQRLKVSEALLRGYIVTTETHGGITEEVETLHGILDLQADYSDSYKHASLKGVDFLHLQAGQHIKAEDELRLLDSMTMAEGVRIYFGTYTNSAAWLGSDNGYIKMGNIGTSSTQRYLVCDTTNDRMRMYSSSSKRYKNQMGYVTDDEAMKLLDLPVVKFVYKDGYLDKDDENYGRTMAGLFAEDVEKMFDDAVYHKDGLIENYADRQLLVRLIKLCQIQQKEIDALKGVMK